MIRKHLKRVTLLLTITIASSLFVSNLNKNNKKVVDKYKATQNCQYKDFYLDKDDTLTIFNDNSYIITNEQGIIVNQE